MVLPCCNVGIKLVEADDERQWRGNFCNSGTYYGGLERIKAKKKKWRKERKTVSHMVVKVNVGGGFDC